MPTFGFIVLRNVNNENTNRYWIHCLECIRRYYPENNILIIDDNSDYNYVTNEEFYKTVVINSEYPKRGEVLPYYYYLYNKIFDVAIIIHDYVFINRYIDISDVKNYKVLWDFQHRWDQVEDETRIINIFNDSELTKFYEDKELWNGCFGGMSIITHDYLTFINSKYDISKLLDCVSNRHNRMSFERVIGCLLQKGLQKEGKQDSFFGDIFIYYSLEKKNFDPNFDNICEFKYLPFIKCWTGR